MAKKIMTLDDLYMFFVQQNKSFNFNAQDSGEPIIVTTDGFFESKEVDMPGMLGLKLKVCHTETNRNGSHISQENMEKAMPTLKYRPILAYIHELPDGTKDFFAHNVEFIEDENGETQVVYIERQVGSFTADDPWLEYDKEMDKTYVMAYAVIPEEYTEAADIIRRKSGTKVSCELVINELSYNAKEKYLDLTDFYFGATTLLGCDEENGSGCMKYYCSNDGEAPVAGFTPDASFPLIQGEKGYMKLVLSKTFTQSDGWKLVNIQGGVAPNVVPQYAKAEILT